MAIQWAHFAAAGIWVGGLVALLTALPALAPGDRLRAAKRFSAIALGCVVVVAASGAQRAYDEVGNLHSLVHAAFGQYVLVKVGLFGLLVVLGALNRSRSLPALPRTVAPLRTTVRLELLVVAAVLVATGILQGLSPPSNTAKVPAVKAIVLTAADFATTVKVRLEISPGTAGFNRFTATATTTTRVPRSAVASCSLSPCEPTPNWARPASHWHRSPRQEATPHPPPTCPSTAPGP